MAFYRFSKACRGVLVNFLRMFLDQEQQHWDGSDWITLPEIHVMDKNEYQARTLPAVVTDSVTGGTQTISFSNIIGSWIDIEGIQGPVGVTYQVLGGRGNFDVTLQCAANDQDLQQKLTDVAAVYLTVGRGWVWNNRHVLMRDVRLSGDGVDNSTPQEPIYYATLMIPVTADWRILIEGETLKRFNFDLDLVTPDDPFEIPGMEVGALTPLDPNPLVSVFNKQNESEIMMPRPIPKEEPDIKPMKTTYGRGS